MDSPIFDARGFSDRRGIVTGASQGIGLATARALVALGATVIGTSRTDAGLARLRAEGVDAHRCDVTIDEDRRRLADAAGSVDFLVNVAGETAVRPLAEVTEANWREVLDSSAGSTFFMCQLMSDRLPSGGAIVNLSSGAGKTSSTPEIGPYAAAKAAVIAETRLFALALAPRGIRVNTVSPGLTDTPGQWRNSETLARVRGQSVDLINSERLARVPLGRVAGPEEIANAIVFLLSAGASYITGQCLNVDGGLVTW